MSKSASAASQGRMLRPTPRRRTPRDGQVRVVVSGLAATYPMGGTFWDYMQYVLGLHQLGHEVLYVEDTGRWCYDPQQQTFVERGDANADYLGRNLAQLDPALGERWFYRDATGRCWGRDWNHVAAFCRSADLFLQISASCWLREEYLAADVLALVDTDPIYTQVRLREPAADGERELYARATSFTFALNMGRPDCRVPDDGMRWLPTIQPVVLACFEPAMVPVKDRRQVLTTVASWEPAEAGPMLDGVRYAGKSAELLKLLDLPRRSPLPLELALSGPAPRQKLLAAGWRLTDPYAVSRDPWIYRDYLARSLGEWSVAKNAYVAGRTGWFSTRTACYLALGVPAVVQDTGFGHALPTGQGLLTFSTADEAVAAIESLAAHPKRHARAARDLAREHLAADRVLPRLLNEALNRAHA